MNFHFLWTLVTRTGLSRHLKTWGLTKKPTKYAKGTSTNKIDPRKVRGLHSKLTTMKNSKFYFYVITKLPTGMTSKILLATKMCKSPSRTKLYRTLLEIFTYGPGRGFGYTNNPKEAETMRTNGEVWNKWSELALEKGVILPKPVR